MCPRHHRFLALSLSVFLVSLIAGVATEQAPPGQPTGDGLVRTELSLSGRTVTLAFTPTLRANDPAHIGVLSAAGGPASGRVRIGQLVTTGTLRIGTSTASVGKPDPAGIPFDLWLEGTTNGWQLQVTDAAKAAVGSTPLERQRGAVASPNLVAALVPEEGKTGRLILRWGEYQATTDLQFTDPARRRNAEETRPNTAVNYTHDEDSSALTRARMLAQRNETALTLAKGPRLSVSFQRTPERGERATDGNARGRGLGVDGPDFAALMKTPDGAIVKLLESSVPRLRTEVPLRFGKVLVATGNLVPGFPGSYGVWLKRVGSGWRLVVNNQPDAWGSQHNPKFDKAEIDLTYTDGHAASRPFAVGLQPTTADRGRLIIVWGPHEWSTDFVTGA